jgi:uncharacterized SAM-dependent methyltransferase
VGPCEQVIEFGAGSTLKVRLLLDHLIDPVAYIPVDISRTILLKQLRARARSSGSTNRTGLRGLHAAIQAAALERRAARNLVFFPARRSATSRGARRSSCSRSWRSKRTTTARLLIGVDLRRTSRGYTRLTTTTQASRRSST